jgi:5-formyltetrahydrofolate cyclo-ligase
MKAVEPDIAARKKLLRQELAARRRELPKAARELAHAAVAADLHLNLPLRGDETVAAYWPLPDEFDTRPLLDVLAAAGHPLCLPVVAMRDAPLVFRAWKPGDRLERGAFGVLAPMADAPIADPEVLLVPMLGFDAAGYRLGYGGGYYDRTLAQRRRRGGVQAVGLAYAAQEVPALPRTANDQPLDAILTENGLRRFG